ncbi:ureidoglycolate hydrolase [Xylaria nigripes]|nr:ureidoglycolate hydrolase [Xylaria nigripes]
MIVGKIPVATPITLTAAPLTSDAFTPFGTVIANPRPDSRPSNTSPDVIARGALPCGAVSTNQGTAIQYKTIAPLQDLYASAPSARAASARMTMFVCGARDGADVGIRILERHPFTSQTFIPLTADKSKRYLVVVAPGGHRPDVGRLRAFCASGDQAVMYAAGTWHAPMIALGRDDATVDFVVVQFANDVPVEDCEEVELGEGVFVSAVGVL